MFKSIAIASAALALILSAGPASAQKIDANGKCHDASGKFAKAEVCGGASSSSSKSSKTAKAAPPASAQTSAAKPAKTETAAKPAKCRDAKGKYIKCPA